MNSQSPGMSIPGFLPLVQRGESNLKSQIRAAAHTLDLHPLGDILKIMEVRFEDRKLARLEIDPSFTAGLSDALVKAFRNRMNFIRQAVDERALYAMKSWHFEKLSGKRAGQHSIRLNDQFRLVVRLERTPAKTVVVIEIVDCH